MQYSATGLALTEAMEGLRHAAYYDCAGVLTIGYGHTCPDVHEGQVISDAQAQALLIGDIAKAVACVNRQVKVTLDQGQFDALVDFTFNEGIGAFTTSTLLRKVNVGDFAGADAEFARWIKAGV